MHNHVFDFIIMSFYSRMLNGSAADVCRIFEEDQPSSVDPDDHQLITPFD
jgi:hypothetical protein